MGKKRKIYYATSEQEDMKKLLIIVLIVIIIIAGAYLLTRAFVTKDLKDIFKSSSDTEEVQSGEINYDVAIVGNILNRPYSTYYVVVYDSTGDDAYDMSELVYSYQNLDKHKHIYTVDLSEYMNKDYYDPENVNLKTDDTTKFKFGDITLLKIKDGKVDKAITSLSKMKKELGV